MPWSLYAILAAFGASCSSILEKRVLNHTHSFGFAASLAFINLAIVSPLFFFVNYGALSWEAITATYSVSVIASFAFFFATRSLRHLEISVAVPLFGFGTVFTTLLAAAVLGESVNLAQGTGILAAVLGVYMLETKPHQNLLDPLKFFWKSRYAHYILFAVCFYAVSTLLDRVVLARLGMEPLAYMAFVHIFIAANFLIAAYVSKENWTSVGETFKTVGWWMLPLAVLTIAHRFAYVEAIKIAEVGMVSAIKRSSTFFTTLVGGELFHEKNLVRKSLASVLIVGGLLLVIL